MTYHLHLWSICPSIVRYCMRISLEPGISNISEKVFICRRYNKIAPRNFDTVPRGKNVINWNQWSYPRLHLELFDASDRVCQNRNNYDWFQISWVYCSTRYIFVTHHNLSEWHFSAGKIRKYTEFHRLHWDTFLISLNCIKYKQKRIVCPLFN